MMRFISPTSVVVCGKRVRLNLNAYRNLHYHTNNKAKRVYETIMWDQLHGERFGPVHLELVLYKQSNRKTDRANILCVTEKFFCDAMVNAGCIPDDSDEYIISTKYSTGGVDKDNPRVEIFVLDAK